MATWSPTSLFNRRTYGAENLSPTSQKDFCNNIGTKRTCRVSRRMSAVEGILLQNYLGLDCRLRFELSRRPRLWELRDAINA